jgi:cytosine/adenosine deaminase-related metal-dependent hydrolase
VRVGLGVDGSASNERSDLFLEVKQALLVARGRGGPTALTAREALRLATRGGAAVLRRDDLGSLEPGKRADLVLLDSPIAHVPYRFGRNPVCLVLRAGEVVWARADAGWRVSW